MAKTSQENIGASRLSQLQHTLDSWAGETRGRLEAALRGRGNIGQLIEEIKIAMAVREALRDITATTTLQEVQNRLLGAPLTEALRDRIAKACPALELHESDLKDAYVEQGKAALSTLSFKLGGAQFLSGFFDRHRTETRNGLTETMRNELLALGDEVALTVGEDYRSLVPLLFGCLRGDMRVLKRVIEAQLELHRQRRFSPSDQPHFFDHVRRFLEVYGDVSEYLKGHSRAPIASLIQERSDRTLSDLFADKRLQYVPGKRTVGDHGNALNLFEILAEYFGEKPEEKSPWFCRKIAGTAYDAQKVGRLITPEIPREALAKVLLEINDHPHHRALRMLRRAVKLYEETYQNLDPQDPDYQTKEKGIRGKILRDLNPALQEEGAQFDLKQTSLQDKIAAAKQFFEKTVDPLEVVQMPSGPSAAPRHLMLRLIHFKSIVKDPEARKELTALLNALEGSDEADQVLLDDPILARTLIILLEEDDPFLDVPLGLTDLTIREHLMRIAFKHFKPDVLRGERSLFQNQKGRPLIRMADREKLPVDEKTLRKNFDTAAVGIPRGLLLKTAEALVHERVYSFDELMQFAVREAAAYFGVKLKGSKKPKEEEPGKPKEPTTGQIEKRYELCFYASAYEAMGDLKRQCFSDWHFRDHVIITSQEYDTITSLFETDKRPGVRPVYVNDRAKNHTRTADELFEEIRKQIDPRHTRMILISSKTRFGDSPCSFGGSAKPNRFHLAVLIQRLKAAYPHIPVAIDAVQALGRDTVEDVTRLGADIYFASGNKALGTGTGSLMAVSEQFSDTLPPERQFKYRRSYLPLENIVAMALGIRMLGRPADFFRLEGNLGDFQNQSLDIKIARHMARLQAHAIKKTSDYGSAFCFNHAMNLVNDLTEAINADAQKQLGCQVIYPVHRNLPDYTGVLTIGFPNLRGLPLQKKLEEKGFHTARCLKDGNALRISFHYLHEPADIDVLFKAIQEIHAEQLRAELREKKGKLADCRNDMTWMPPG